MRIALPFLHVASAITVSTALTFGSPALAAEQTRFAMSVPRGFEELSSERQTVLDVYYGGRKLGETRAKIQTGFLTFDDAGAVARLIPEVAALPELVVALSGRLPANVALACGASRRPDCGVLRPARAGVILDEDHFRVEIFVDRAMLKAPNTASPTYLPEPDQQSTLISHFGATLSGSDQGDRSYHLQNRSIASIGGVRIRSDSSLASRSGLAFDNLTFEAERSDQRYLAGIFWVPGTELVGRRKIIGLGATTQLDTRSDKQALISTPLTVFLQNSARVEIFLSGRLVSSGIYSAGQRLVDTAPLPNGSYEVILKVREDGRPAREEKRFFTKGTQMAPLGRPLLSVFAGLLPSSDRGLSLGGKTIFYQASAAYRLSPDLGVDGTVIGTQHKALVEGGLVFHTRLAQFRLGALASTRADIGAVFRASSVGQGPLAASFDLRMVRSRDEQPLLPISTSQGSFSADPEANLADRGSYTQGLAIISYRLRRAQLRFTGVYRQNGSDKATYSVGTSVEFPVVRTSRWELLLQADARKTERDFASFFGARFHITGGNLAFSGSAGFSRSSGSGRSTQMISEVQAGWHHQREDHSQLSIDAAYGRDSSGSYARASGFAHSSRGNARADVLHNFGKDGATQIAASLNTSLIVARDRMRLGGRQINDSAVVVSVGGGETDQIFEVLVDEVVRGLATSDNGLPLFLKPYESYDVRLRPRQAQMSSFDTAARKVTLYPGNVAKLEWDITPLVVVFGRAVSASGEPVANADVTGSRGIGHTDKDGYFQIETNRADVLRVVDRRGASCSMTFPDRRPVKGYIAAGDVVCQ